jgi:hypothetical protein
MTDRTSRSLQLHHGARWIVQGTNQVLEFTTPLQFAEIKAPQGFRGIKSRTIGGWSFPHRTGGQNFYDPVGRDAIVNALWQIFVFKTSISKTSVCGAAGLPVRFGGRGHHGETQPSDAKSSTLF